MSSAKLGKTVGYGAFASVIHSDTILCGVYSQRLRATRPMPAPQHRWIFTHSVPARSTDCAQRSTPVGNRQTSILGGRSITDAARVQGIAALQVSIVRSFDEMAAATPGAYHQLSPTIFLKAAILFDGTDDQPFPDTRAVASWTLSEQSAPKDDTEQQSTIPMAEHYLPHVQQRSAQRHGHRGHTRFPSVPEPTCDRVFSLLLLSRTLPWPLATEILSPLLSSRC